MNKKVLIISHISGTGGNFLDYFLMNHKEVFYKGYLTVDRNNEYWGILANDESNYRNRWELCTTKSQTDFINTLATTTEDTIHGERTYKTGRCKYITTTIHLTENRCIYNDAVLLGIYIDDDVIPYIKSLLELKFTGRKHREDIKQEPPTASKWIEDILRDGFNEYYLKCIDSEIAPTHLINYKSFFIDQEEAEYIKLCNFLSIVPDIEMYMKAIDYYMYMNNKLLKDFEEFKFE